MSSNNNNNMSSEISDSLLQDVNSQWIDQLDGAEETTSEHEQSIDQADDVVEEASVAEHRIPSVESDAEVELPQPLRQLIATGGVKLVAVPDGTWNIDGFAAKLRRTLSVTFSVDSTISSEDVVEAFCKLELTLRIFLPFNTAVPTVPGASPFEIRLSKNESSRRALSILATWPFLSLLGLCDLENVRPVREYFSRRPRYYLGGVGRTGGACC